MLGTVAGKGLPSVDERYAMKSRKHQHGPSLFRETLGERLRWMGYWLLSRGGRRGREVREQVEVTATDAAERARTVAHASAERLQAGRDALRTPQAGYDAVRN